MTAHDGTDAAGDATLVTDLLSGRALLRQLRLRVVEGPDKGKSLPLRGSVFIGSGKGADLVVADKRVSRLHCEVQRTDDGVRVKDNGSKNGVFVDDVRLHDARLPAGARFRVGSTTVGVFAEDTPVSLEETSGRFGGLSALSQKMRALHALLRRAARSDVTVLLEGETGSGKEVLARALHAEGKRKKGPFLVVDCGALSRDLLGSELFGHRRGAFTGAVADRQGLFEAAAGGTIFLDEIGELPLDLQPALLRVLETRQVRRLGEQTPRPVDVRIIAATHRDLAARVKAGAFREDLFFRLAVVRARVPALRERLEDLPLLCDQLLADLGTRVRPSADDLSTLRRHPWPGNVRELKNALEQALALGDGASFDFKDGLELMVAAADDVARADDVVAVADLLGLPWIEAREKALERFERRLLARALDAAGGNVSRAAESLGLTRTYAHRVLKKAGLRGAGV